MYVNRNFAGIIKKREKGLTKVKSGHMIKLTHKSYYSAMKYGIKERIRRERAWERFTGAQQS